MRDEELEAEFAALADEAPWFAILTEADVDLWYRATRRGVNWVTDYSPIDDEDEE